MTKSHSTYRIKDFLLDSFYMDSYYYCECGAAKILVDGKPTCPREKIIKDIAEWIDEEVFRYEIPIIFDQKL